MATKAYFLINVAEKFSRDGYQGILKDLEAIPEVESVERVTGASDLLVKVEAPIRMIFVANKILAKEWVKRLHVLHVESIKPEEYQGLSIDELIRLKRIMPAERS
jgi:hypothetical protein